MGTLRRRSVRRRRVPEVKYSCVCVVYSVRALSVLLRCARGGGVGVISGTQG